MSPIEETGFSCPHWGRVTGSPVTGGQVTVLRCGFLKPPPPAQQSSWWLLCTLGLPLCASPMWGRVSWSSVSFLDYSFHVGGSPPLETMWRR